MAMIKLGRDMRKPPLGFLAKASLVVLLGLSFVVIWSEFLSPSSFLSARRGSFDDMKLPSENTGDVVAHADSSLSSTTDAQTSSPGLVKQVPETNEGQKENQREGERGSNPSSDDEIQREIKNESTIVDGDEAKYNVDQSETMGEGEGDKDLQEVTKEENKIDEATNGDIEVNNGDDVQGGAVRKGGNNAKNRSKRISEPLFDHKTHYNWKLCSGKSAHNYIPCMDLEGTASGRLQSHRHHQRSCPVAPQMCLTPLPQGYESPLPWPDSKFKIFYRNVAHPRLSAFVKTQNWLKLLENYLTFPGNESIFNGGAARYLDSIQEIAPDIDWGKNIRVVLDIGSTDASFGFALLENDVLTLSLGLMKDQTDLAQLYLERGMPAVLDNLGSRKLPFPCGVFDAVHCGECNIPWHINGGKILLEINRLLRPGGYFIVSFQHGDIEGEEAMSNLTKSICWNTLAHKTDDETDFSIKMYQRPSSNDVYELNRIKGPPLCKNEENQDSVWYSPIEYCLHTVPTSIEQRGTDWPEEWPKRLVTFPEWLVDSQEKLMADTEYWKAIVNKSYLNGMGIDWTHVRNVMDMKTVYGGFAAALALHNVWVMNVVPVHAPNTLPVIYERGLIGIYHDWCEPFSTYSRSYDLLHVDHLFSRLKNRCKQPVSIVVEMDRILRPGGWVIIRERLEILNPLEEILKTLHWDIKMTFSQNKQGIICAQKTVWRP